MEKTALSAVEKHFVEIISAVVFGTNADRQTDADFDRLRSLAEEHALSAMLYVGLKEIYGDLNTDCYKKIENSFYSTLLKGTAQDKALSMICDRFSECKIRHLPLKGRAIKQLYPDPDLRTMGDIDILIDQDNRSKADGIMQSLGYTPGERSKICYDYSKDIIHVEIHTQMSDISVLKNKHIDNIWENAVKTQQYTYTLGHDAQLFFAIYHIAKHITLTGCGLRMVLDIAVMADRYRDSLNRAEFADRLRETGLLTFACYIFGIIYDWFSVPSPIEERTLDNHAADMLQKIILRHGTFGMNNSGYEIAVLRRGASKNESGGSSFWRNIKSVWKNVFRDPESMRINFPILERHGWLLPLYWVIRVIKKRKNAKRILKMAIKDDKRIEDELNLMKKIGL
ncbi:MAG: nucleotidyltransferase family protein [Oscillospiraceae bacterium]|nr:nucleotidyltransferase family protein [Oscillospiraceae bacterium]